MMSRWNLDEKRGSKEGWLSGRKHLTANEAVRNGTGVRIPHLPQTPRDVQRAIPVSRLIY